ncbi:anhydro-N-acetylmuramic acid kinase [Alcanivorax sp. NBRC 102028]|uniref:anhydro-N-acetylmuramic acid kinase n=1 Tax=Alcanivorax sp. NBRC 102028 TaxID=1113897 RepID=UPI000789D41F|nr:anhydro-N-acetylmuramic acid kinase [Alcanivorax sp. NBRC 102028]
MSSKAPPALFIGLMTGTSLDGIDAVIADISDNHFTLVSTLSQPIPESLRGEILGLCQPGNNEIDRAGAVSLQLAEHYANTCQTLLDQAAIAPEQVRAIGCHGQTVRHRPHAAGFSVQLGCPDTLAVKTGIAVVSNFRNKDIALGGQGAPLVPPFHQQLFARPDQRIAVVNIGGMANVTLLENGQLSGGFDTGPGNVLMDSWIQQHHQRAYDRNGDWAASAQPDLALLNTLLSDPYFRLPPPKSTGRERFSLDWLNEQLANHSLTASVVQASLAELTAHSISDALSDFQPDQVLICGGGAHNQHLLERIQALLSTPVTSTAKQGLAPDWVEAAAFAWLAWARMEEKAGNAPMVTGASRETILGQVTLP